jgi:hypothetical protein
VSCVRLLYFLLDFEVGKWGRFTGDCNNVGVYPPHGVDGQPGCVSVFEDGHLEDAGEGDGKAAETRYFGAIVP